MCVISSIFFFFWKERENRGNVYDPRKTVKQHLKTQKRHELENNKTSYKTKQYCMLVAMVNLPYVC